MSWRAQFSKHVQEVAFFFCTEGKSSHGVRTFLVNNYWDLKKLNPMFPFLVREGKDLDPYILVGYDLGREEVVYLKDKTEEEINQILKQVVKKGSELPKSQSKMKWDDIRPEERRWKQPNHWLKLATTPTKMRPEKLVFGVPKNDTYTGPSDFNTLDEDMAKVGLK